MQKGVIKRKKEQAGTIMSRPTVSPKTPKAKETSFGCRRTG